MTHQLDLAATAAQQDAAFVESLNHALTAFFATERQRVTAISPHAVRLVDEVERLTQGGKKLRARLCYWGWRAAGGERDSFAVVQASAALELFQSAALIHDDILDRSDTRRGYPSVHRTFQDLHHTAQWRDDSEHFGLSAGILVGDLTLSFAEQVFAAATSHVPPQAAVHARSIFDTMRTEVMVGQYLDVHAEVAPTAQDSDEALSRAMKVLRYKSAKYSVQHPVAIGAALAGASEKFVAECSDFTLPVGEAFQLRDDVLGVFGDPSTTGKPAGDDIREGKRTALVALTIRGAEPQEVAWLESALGSSDLSDQDVAHARLLMRETGALNHTETLISKLVSTADEKLAKLDTDDISRAGLSTLADAAVRRRR